ncbi:hypothetical protein [Streptomyces sp. NBC_01637]|uniref:hypothetical protein n=1 Tax=unclassified Streptomyces TaxID=2593676 RepID=UPI003869A427|nr:hypothetical protein OH719_01250 [Streptomyces sp. NBC_01653]WTC84466.1 hypothetical protein OH719_45620 [Streptomyces sp. NBC_01653]WTD86401.1 hypothetical protein OG891_01250 [Streptomyces sp. NBC_01637]WTD94123.1 hypothetical protein OG891_45615 [Streptomyces sp. NBC_01637]
MSGPARDNVPEEPRLWQVKIAMVATPAEHEELMDRLSNVLCSDPDHEGPCAIPWAMHSVNGDSLSRCKRNALLTEIKETNWNPEEDDGTGKTGGRWRPA